MTRDEMRDWRVQDVAKDIVETHAQATPRDWGAPDHALYKLIVAKLVAERDRIAALRAPAVTGEADKAFSDALNDALYKDTQVGHMLPWREVTRLCDALKQRLAAPPAAGAPPALVALDKTVRQFLGWLSADLPELHHVEVPRLAESWDRYRSTIIGSPAPAPVAPPAETPDRPYDHQAGAANPARVPSVMHEMADLLRSACAIAERRGSGTAWERFIESVYALGLNGVTARTYRVLPHEVPAPVAPERCGYVHEDGWTCGRAKGHPSVHVPPSRMANPPAQPLREMQHAPRPDCDAEGWHLCAPPAVAQARDEMIEQLDSAGFFQPRPPAVAGGDRIQFSIGGTGEAGSDVAGGDAAPETPDPSFRGSCEGCPYPDTCSWFRRCTFRRRRQEGQQMAAKTARAITKDEFYKAIEAAGHLLITDGGEIDIFQMAAGYCNGPGCACGDSWCHHCRKLDSIRPCSRKARG